MSPETIDENGEININGIRFTKNKPGIVPAILDELYNIRKGYKAKIKISIFLKHRVLSVNPLKTRKAQ